MTARSEAQAAPASAPAAGGGAGAAQRTRRRAPGKRLEAMRSCSPARWSARPRAARSAGRGATGGCTGRRRCRASLTRKPGPMPPAVPASAFRRGGRHLPLDDRRPRRCAGGRAQAGRRSHGPPKRNNRSVRRRRSRREPARPTSPGCRRAGAVRSSSRAGSALADDVLRPGRRPTRGRSRGGCCAAPLARRWRPSSRTPAGPMRASSRSRPRWTACHCCWSPTLSVHARSLRGGPALQPAVRHDRRGRPAGASAPDGARRGAASSTATATKAGRRAAASSRATRSPRSTRTSATSPSCGCSRERGLPHRRLRPRQRTRCRRLHDAARERLAAACSIPRPRPLPT